jgi:hypothetical protein
MANIATKPTLPMLAIARPPDWIRPI